ncbi:hypothetical protein FRC11_008354, partial [Ceratobasidium sp. 423]
MSDSNNPTESIGKKSKNSKRRIKKIIRRLESATLGRTSRPPSEASSDAGTTATEAGGSSDVDSIPPDATPSHAGSSKRPATHGDTPPSPEHPRRPAQKRSRVEISLDPKGVGLSEPEHVEVQNTTETERGALQQGKARRGKRGGHAVREQIARWKRFRAYKDLQQRGETAENVLRTLRFLGKEVPLPKDINDLSAEEAIEFAKDHRVNKEENFYVFNATKQAEAWRRKNGVEPGQFDKQVLTENDLKNYNFRIFNNGTIYAFEDDDKGNEELVFSAIFIPFSDMDKGELDDFRFLGQYFAERRDSRDGLITNNSAHMVEGA